MSSEPRRITLPTRDAGDVTLDEPTWCVGHADHRPDSYRVDLDHKGPEHLLRHNGELLWSAFIGEAPFASRPEVRAPGLFVEQASFARTLNPAAVYDLAATFEAHADRLRELADQLTAILGGER
ncbi:DUF6907 domain-containing protein [Streptomyces lincolnensis]|uniref:DUF6907 domain-containing protein n=1 Tax=Streptomyces lincolnensis TaxID=1915 RepID=UPI0037CFFCBB